jgi:hypothetical protein
MPARRATLITPLSDAMSFHSPHYAMLSPLLPLRHFRRQQRMKTRDVRRFTPFLPPYFHRFIADFHIADILIHIRCHAEYFLFAAIFRRMPPLLPDFAAIFTLAFAISPMPPAPFRLPPPFSLSPFAAAMLLFAERR